MMMSTAAQIRTLPPRRRRGSVIIIVLWAIAIAAIVTSAVQLFGYRQATLGMETMHRVKARWAARAGIEQNIAVMADHTMTPYPNDAFALIRDLEDRHFGDLGSATWDIRHHADGSSWLGPMDEHSKMNINIADGASLLALHDITPDVIDAINDWRDEDSEIGGFGIERDYYLSLNPPYEPRNGPLRTTTELELVGGVWPRDFRGEDWNLNSRLDPNEDDGEISFPIDDADGKLDTGWSGMLTAYSVANGVSMTGEERLVLRRASIEELSERIGVTLEQANVLIRFGRNSDNRLEQLVTRSIRNIDPNTGQMSEQPVNPNLEGLTSEQLSLLLSEVTMTDPLNRQPGKININTVSHRLLEEMILNRGGSEVLVDELLFLRRSRPEGILSIQEFQDLPEADLEMIEFLMSTFTTRSNVFKIASRGRSEGGNAVVEIIAVVDRSTVPVRILEYREQ